MVIQINNASLKRNDTYIIKNITWSVKPGQHWALVGLNGSGKTTLLNIINGYIWPTSGEISILDNKFGQCDLRQLRKSIGWVSSSLQERLYGDETAQEIVLSGKHASIGLYVQPDQQDITLADGLLEEMGCGPLAMRQYKTLSQGEKQKVLIARALISSPQLLILDEPCTGLDLFAREQFLDTVEKLAHQDSSPTLLYVSHHIEEILPVFRHTLLLRKGEIHSAGKTKEVLSGPNLSDFFGLPVQVEWHNERIWVRRFAHDKR